MSDDSPAPKPRRGPCHYCGHKLDVWPPYCPECAEELAGGPPTTFQKVLILVGVVIVVANAVASCRGE